MKAKDMLLLNNIVTILAIRAWFRLILLNMMLLLKETLYLIELGLGMLHHI